MPEYVVTSRNGWSGWRVNASDPREAAEIASAKEMLSNRHALEEVPAPMPAEWIVIDVNGARLGKIMPVQAHRYRRSV